MIDHILTQDCELITTTTDKHGDQKQSASTSLKCKFRYISATDKQVNSEAFISEAMMWFTPDSGIVETNILKFDNQYWRVDRLVQARRLSDPTIQFLKAFVNKHSL